MRHVVCVACLTAAFTAVLSAQQPPPDVVVPAGNVLLANSNSVPIGPNAGLEGSAYVARVGDPSAAWLNPAGLSRAIAAELSGSSGLFQVSTLSPSDVPGSGGSVYRIPSLVGFIVKGAFGGKLTLAVSLATVTSWSQDTDSELIVNSGSSAERFAFSADSRFDRFVGVGSAGYVNGKWRLGAGLAVVQTSLEKNAVVSTRTVDPAVLRSFVLESRVRGSAFHLRPVFGVQYDASDRLRLGVMARTPAPQVYSSGSITSEGVTASGGATGGVSLFDPDAAFAAKLPFEVRGGAAYIGRRLEVEVDISAETPIGAYDMLTSDKSIVTYSGAPAGPPVVSLQAFSGLVSHSKAVVNVAVGGHVLLSNNGVWRLHFGGGTDRSGVAPDDELFTKIHLGAWTLGVSGTKDKLQFTAGVNYRSGSSDSITVGQLPSGALVRSGMGVRTVGIIYSLSYKF
jgi:hypothetical protein